MNRLHYAHRPSLCIWLVTCFMPEGNVILSFARHTDQQWKWRTEKMAHLRQYHRRHFYSFLNSSRQCSHTCIQLSVWERYQQSCSGYMVDVSTSSSRSFMRRAVCIMSVSFISHYRHAVSGAVSFEGRKTRMIGIPCCEILSISQQSNALHVLLYPIA